MLVLLVSLAFIFAGAVAAHTGPPGHTHGTDEVVVEADPSTGTGSTGTSGSSSSSQTSSGSSTGGSSSSGSSAGESQSDQTGTIEGQTTGDDNNTNATASSESDQETTTGSGSSNWTIVAIVGLIAVIGLVVLAFPFKKGGAISNFRSRLLGR